MNWKVFSSSAPHFPALLTSRTPALPRWTPPGLTASGGSSPPQSAVEQQASLAALIAEERRFTSPLTPGASQGRRAFRPGGGKAQFGLFSWSEHPETQILSPMWVDVTPLVVCRDLKAHLDTPETSVNAQEDKRDECRLFSSGGLIIGWLFSDVIVCSPCLCEALLAGGDAL